MLKVVIDIETIGASDCADFLEPVSAPSNWKDAQKIAEYCAEKQAERIARAGLEADLCEVIAIGFMQAQYSTGAAVYTRADVSEAELLTWLWQAVANPNRTIIGFNTLSFDLPVLIRRSQLLGIAYPDLNLDRYRTPHVDLLQKLTFNGALAMRSLNFYAKRFGIPCHDMTTGKDIAALVAANDWATVTAHCRDDVEVTGALARRLGFLPQLAAESAVA